MSTPGLERVPALTDRERAVLGLMGLGRTVAHIAGLLHLSPHTVIDHKRSIYAKLGVRSQSHAVSRAIALGLFDPAGAAVSTPPSGQATVTVVRGPPGLCLSEVTRTLRAHGEPFLFAPACGAPVPPEGPAQDHHQPAVVLVDPDRDAWALPESLHAPAVVVHSTAPDVALTLSAVLHGAYALLGTADVRENLCPALALARHGYRTLSPANTRLLADWAATLAPLRTPATPELTSREREILVSIGRGHTVTQTARSLGIAVKTVENLQSRLFRKLGTRNRSQTLVAAYRSGLLGPDCAMPDPR